MQVEASMPSATVMPIDFRALAPASFLEAYRPASYWSPARGRIVEQAYGQWLGFPDRNDDLYPSATPGERATVARLGVFVAGLRGHDGRRPAPHAGGPRAGAGLDGPGAGLQPPQANGGAGGRQAVLQVPASELLEFGIGLMDTCDRGQNETYKVTRYRDGLLIALLISCPMRLKNLAGLVIGQHLVFDGYGYRVETKTGRPYVAEVPHELTPYIERWLQVHRPSLPLMAAVRAKMVGMNNHLWLSRSGKPIGSDAIRSQIESRTRQAFGNAIWPHLFRDCAVTELVDSAPEEIGIAPDLLGHADLQTTRRHYIQAQGVTAHRLMQEAIAARRRAAAARRVEA